MGIARRTILVGIFGSLLLVAGQALAGAPEPLELLTPEEAALADPPPGPVQAGRLLNDGPEIVVSQPRENVPYNPPIPIVVHFIPNNGRDVDLTKLKIEVLKIITIDITLRALPYVTKEGINVEKASLPSGEHKIRVTIGDVSGGMTERVFRVKVL